MLKLLIVDIIYENEHVTELDGLYVAVRSTNSFQMQLTE